MIGCEARVTLPILTIGIHRIRFLNIENFGILLFTYYTVNPLYNDTVCSKLSLTLN